MTDKQVKLYGYVTSPFVIKVGIFLKYKQIPFELVPVNPIRPVQLKRFPGQRRVPVLEIGDEWRHDSTPLGIWLDEVFPERPILGDTPGDTEQILEMDRWVTDELIMALFRQATEWNQPWNTVRNGWILSRALNATTPLPLPVRVMWPLLVPQAGFVRRFAASAAPGEPTEQMRVRQFRELADLLAEGPFLGGRTRVSLADLSAYSTIAMTHYMGMHGDFSFLHDEAILGWCRRVQAELPANPLVMPDRLLERSHL